MQEWLEFVNQSFLIMIKDQVKTDLIDPLDTVTVTSSDWVQGLQSDLQQKVTNTDFLFDAIYITRCVFVHSIRSNQLYLYFLQPHTSISKSCRIGVL